MSLRAPSTVGNTMTDDPKCDKCGAPITTGLMAIYCPKGRECEFYVPEQAEFIEELRINVRGQTPERS